MLQDVFILEWEIVVQRLSVKDRKVEFVILLQGDETKTECTLLTDLWNVLVSKSIENLVLHLFWNHTLIAKTIGFNDLDRDIMEHSKDWII